MKPSFCSLRDGIRGFLYETIVLRRRSFTIALFPYLIDLWEQDSGFPGSKTMVSHR